MGHALAIQEVFTTVATLHGTVPLLSGYVGVCECGARSELYGAPSPIPLWHTQHVDPTGRKARAVRKGIR